MESFKRRQSSSTEQDGDNKRLCRNLTDGQGDIDAVFNYGLEEQAQPHPQLCRLNDQQFALEEEYSRGTTIVDNLNHDFYPGGDGTYALPGISTVGDTPMPDYDSMDLAFCLPAWSSYDSNNAFLESTHQLSCNQSAVELGNGQNYHLSSIMQIISLTASLADIAELNSANIGPVEQTTPSLLEVPTISPSPISTRIATPNSISEVPGYRCSTVTASSDTLRPLPAHESLGAKRSTSNKTPEVVDEPVSRNEDVVMEDRVDNEAEGAQFDTCFGEVSGPYIPEIRAKVARLWWEQSRPSNGRGTQRLSELV